MVLVPIHIARNSSVNNSLGTTRSLGRRGWQAFGLGLWLLSAVVVWAAGLRSCSFDRKARPSGHPALDPNLFVSRGVSKIRLVDFDYVTLSSLNRHATATLADVGTPKVACIERTLRDISRWVEVDSRVEIWRKEDAGKLLEGVDWVVGKRYIMCPSKLSR